LRDLLLFIHPLPILIVVAAFLFVRARLTWPGGPSWFAWSALPVLINSPLWLYGSKLFGWTLGGLGGWMYFYFVLPLNALVFGVVSAPVLQSMLIRMPNTTAKLGVGGALQVLVLAVNLGVSSAFGFYRGNLAP
jgi:hypothetical protein